MQEKEQQSYDFGIISIIRNKNGVRETTIQIGQVEFTVTDFNNFEKELEELINKYRI